MYRIIKRLAEDGKVRVGSTKVSELSHILDGLRVKYVVFQVNDAESVIELNVSEYLEVPLVAYEGNGVKVYYVYDDGYGGEPLMYWYGWDRERDVTFDVRDLPNWIDFEEVNSIDSNSDPISYDKSFWAHTIKIIEEAVRLGHLKSPYKEEGR